MVAPLIPAFLAGPIIAELVSGPLSSMLSTVIPHENVTIRTALRMVATGALSPTDFSRLNAVNKLELEDRRIIVAYAHELHRRFSEVTLRTLQKPFMKEGIDVLRSLDDFDKAEFLGGLDDSTKRLNDVENELVRLDRAERDAWMKGELSFNDVLTRIVEDRIKKTAVVA